MNQRLKLRNSFILNFAICFLILLPTISEAAYKIYLKNGSVITGISHYEKSDGEVMLYLEAGVIGVPEADILKIEAGKDTDADVAPKEKQAEEKTAPSELDADRITPESYKSEKPVEAERSELEKVIGEIEKKEAELKKTEEELLRTQARIQNLFPKSLKGTITGEERAMLQQNMFKKSQLEESKKKLEEELKALYAEKQRLGG